MGKLLRQRVMVTGPSFAGRERHRDPTRVRAGGSPGGLLRADARPGPQGRRSPKPVKQEPHSPRHTESRRGFPRGPPPRGSLDAGWVLHKQHTHFLEFHHAGDLGRISHPQNESFGSELSLLLPLSHFSDSAHLHGLLKAGMVSSGAFCTFFPIAMTDAGDVAFFLPSPL